MMQRLVKPLTLLLCTAPIMVHAQSAHSPAAILVDALAFHGPDITEKAFLDVYVAVPYQAIQFQELSGRYAAQYTATIVLRDKFGNKQKDTSVRRSKVEDNYSVTQGGDGSTDNVVTRFLMSPGTYHVEVTIKDAFAHTDRTVTDSLVVPDFQNTPAFSSLLYVSQIEAKGERYSITPFIGRTIWNQEQPLFVFFEYYLKELPASVAFSWSLASSDERILGGGLGSPVQIQKRTSQHFIPIQCSAKATPGSYVLTVNAHPVASGTIDTSVILATSHRDYVIPKTFAGNVTSNLTVSIKQLAYIATQSDIDQILGAGSEADRLTLFEDYWKRQDPTPRTVRNEAFEEYYRRVATANKLYKSYADGWMTDMGRVYIVCGEPSSRERIPSQYGSSQLERWYYPNNVTFVFEDTGFGDYRLRTPLPLDFKYHYR